MRLLMLMGAVIGFGVGFTFSALQQSPWPTMVWHACIAAYISGMLLRWWGRSWEKNLRLALQQKHDEALRSMPPPNATKR